MHQIRKSKTPLQKREKREKGKRGGDGIMDACIGSFFLLLDVLIFIIAAAAAAAAGYRSRCIT